ncbi:unnamed protein product, partial [Symbiodinium pilosum]
MARQGHLHFEGAESMIEEVPLVEAPSRPARKSWWYVAGAGVATLAVVGLAKSMFPSSLTFGKTSGVMSMQEVQHWEDIPGIDKAVNNGALCAGDFTALTANFGEIATVGAAARADCNFEKNVHAILTNPEPKEVLRRAEPQRRLDEAPDRMLPTRKWTQFVPAGAAPAVEKYVKVKGHVEANRNRGFDIAQCVADVTNSAAYIVR